MASQSMPGLPSKHGRVLSADERQSSPVRHGASSPSQPRNEGAIPTASTASSSHQNLHQSLAEQNEGIKGVKEDPSTLATWDAWHHHWLNLWAAFGNWNNRQVLKDISASPAVLRTYHDSFLFGEVPWAVKTRATLRSGVIGSIWNLWIISRAVLQSDAVGTTCDSQTAARRLRLALLKSQTEFVLAAMSGVLYVYSTYEPELRVNWAFRIQNVISFAFAADYVLRVYCEPVRLYFIFSFWGLIDLLSMLPIILVFRHNISGASVIELFQFVRFMRIFSFNNGCSIFGSSVSQQIVLLSIATLGVIFLDAGLLQWVEYHLAPASRKATCSVQGCITFWESLYFLIVTVATVGYGDIVPKTMIGQLIAIITIIGALTILPLQIGRITALAYRRPYGGSFSSRKIIGSRFLIISGSIKFSVVQTFLAEFYNPTHSEDLEVFPLRVIILAPFTPSFELKQILTLYNGYVEFIEGSPVRQGDLERVNAHQAAAFFLLADEGAENHQVEDAAQIVRALAVHRFCKNANRFRRKVRIILEVLDPETQSSAVWDLADKACIEVICAVEIHYKMMARSCTIHGLYTLITNLFTAELQLKYMNRKHFLTEYFHSFDSEVYPVVLPKAFHGLSFEEVVEFIFVTFNSTLMGLDIEVGYKPDGEVDRKVLFYPKGHIISSDDVGIVIASDLHTAYAISTYCPKEDAESVFHKFWVRVSTKHWVRRHNQGTELLDPTSGKWRRTSSTVSRANSRGSTIGSNTPTFGEMGTSGHPSHLQARSTRRLESRLRIAIQDVYSPEQYPEWGQNHSATVDIGIVQGRDVEAPEKAQRVENIKAGGGEPANEYGPRFPRGMSLEKAAHQLLSWPPLSYLDRPHPALIAEKEDVIMKDLKERTITMVAFNVPHILVCCQSGWPVHFFYFLVAIRRPGSPNPPVVMLYPRDVNAKQWGTVGAFKDVYFLKGSPLYELDLLRGGVLQAEKIVILSDQGVPVDLGGEKWEEKKYLKQTPAAFTSDVENIIIAANVQRLYGCNLNNSVIVEMKTPEGFFYLRPQYEISRAHFPMEGFRRNKEALVHFIPPYMEGKAISAAMLGFLMRASFYNRNTVSIVEQLIDGGYGKTESGDIKKGNKTLDQMPVPEQYASRPYSDLFLSLLRDKGLLAIGLYRCRGTLGAPTSYVLTNPTPDCIVNPDDLVYILH